MSEFKEIEIIKVNHQIFNSDGFGSIENGVDGVCIIGGFDNAHEVSNVRLNRAFNKVEEVFASIQNSDLRFLGMSEGIYKIYFEVFGRNHETEGSRADNWLREREFDEHDGNLDCAAGFGYNEYWVDGVKSKEFYDGMIDEPEEENGSRRVIR